MILGRGFLYVKDRQVLRDKWKGIYVWMGSLFRKSERRRKGVYKDFNWDDFSCKGVQRGKFKIL